MNKESTEYEYIIGEKGRELSLLSKSPVDEKTTARLARTIARTISNGVKGAMDKAMEKDSRLFGKIRECYKSIAESIHPCGLRELACSNGPTRMPYDDQAMLAFRDADTMELLAEPGNDSPSNLLTALMACGFSATMLLFRSMRGNIDAIFLLSEISDIWLEPLKKEEKDA